ncbi:MAG: dihydrolipoyl dehydrogenase family protein, partial [Alphaproteobacteria bacterium]
MGETIEVDLCVIGAGSGGLTVAAGASQMGASVVLIEKGRMGGDCLNYGCVPSKSLIAAANAAHGLGRARRFGVEADARVDFPAVRRHVEGVIAAIAPNDSEARFEGLGVRVIRTAARFTGPHKVEADGRLVRARRFVIATGSRPLVPPIPGLESSPHLTNETIFECRQAPEHLIVIGGGPIGIELAQAHRRLGARVTVVEMATILGKDDPELVDVLRARLRAEGVGLMERTKVVEVAARGSGAAVALEGDGGRRWVEGSHLLVAVGRRPNVEDLGLDAAGVEHTRQGVTVDRRLRTTNPRIYAVGDVAGGP